MEIIPAQTASELEQIKELFREYFEFLVRDHGLDLTFQGIADELAALPGKFAPPEGRLMLAVEADQPAGCAALRPLDAHTCEMKRMFVRPQYRGRGMGRALAELLIQEARQIGYQRMRLDTGETLTAAVGLYEALGFRPIAPYYDVPEELRQGTIFMELALV